MYFDGPNPVLTPRERKGLAIEGQWSGTSLSTRDLPAPGADGMIRYVYGTVQASVVCAVLQICDVELQPGETIKGVDIGDSARWVVNVTAAGEPPNVTEHLILKPTDVGLTTSMVITTNRRVYHLLLRSHRTQTMVRVGWTYPEDLNKRIAERRRQLDAQRIEQTLPATNEYLGDLSFAYRVTGEAPWKPIRVYNDGAKTIIQLSKEVQASEAPTLLVLRSEGNLFQKEEVAVVNYRLQRDRYIVDQVFDRAVLIAGVGGSQTRVTIEREVQR
jgi:type IV secretion system protein VirB9